MRSHEAHSAMYGVQNILLALGGHRRLAVRAQRRKIAGGKKDDPGASVTLFRIENASVLSYAHLEAVLVSQVRHRVVHDARLSVDSFYNVVFPSRRLRENKHPLFV